MGARQRIEQRVADNTARPTEIEALQKAGKFEADTGNRYPESLLRAVALNARIRDLAARLLRR